jgi:hypothetical protein
VGNPACPVNEKKYVPGTGAVNFPVDKFMALPMLRRETWKGIGTFAVLKGEFRWM